MGGSAMIRGTAIGRVLAGGAPAERGLRGGVPAPPPRQRECAPLDAVAEKTAFVNGRENL